MSDGLWYALAFLTFVGLIYRPFVSFLTGHLDRYRHLVLEQMTDAESLKEKAQKLLDEQTQVLHDLQVQMTSLHQKVIEDFKATEQDQREKQKMYMDQRLKAFERSKRQLLEKYKKQMVDDLILTLNQDFLKQLNADPILAQSLNQGAQKKLEQVLQ